MLKYVKLYESFVAEAANAAVTTTKSIKLNKGIEEKVELAADLSEQLKKLSKEYMEKIAPMQDTLNKYDAEILETLTSLNVNQATVNKIIAKVMVSKGRLSDSYKSLWEEALKKVNDATKTILLAMQQANKKQNPDKYWMEYDKKNEGLKEIAEYGKDFVKKMKDWVSNVWKGLKEAILGHEKAVDNLETVAEKILIKAMAKSDVRMAKFQN
jgi:phosphate uptake regulator